MAELGQPDQAHAQKRGINKGQEDFSGLPHVHGNPLGKAAGIGTELDATKSLDQACKMAQDEGFDVCRIDFTFYLRKSIGAGEIRYVPYRDDVLGLTEEELTPLFPNRPWKRELFATLAARVRQAETSPVGRMNGPEQRSQHSSH